MPQRCVRAAALRQHHDHAPEGLAGTTITVAELACQGKLDRLLAFKNTSVSRWSTMYLTISIPLILLVRHFREASDREIKAPHVTRASVRSRCLRALPLGRQERGRLHHRTVGLGKSTILRCINGLESYDAGDMSWRRGVDSNAPSIVAIRTQVSMYSSASTVSTRQPSKNVVEGPIHVNEPMPAV